MNADRLDWIFDSEHSTLAQRYDEWAATYDADHDDWGWRGPELVATTVLTNLGKRPGMGVIVDAGCGTGKVGVALRRAGWHGGLVGLDLSSGMLAEAAKSGAYDELVRCSLYDVPLADDVATAIVSAGVFTLGHVGGEAFAELCRIVQPGGVVTVTQRIDLADGFVPHSDALTAAGAWAEIERTAPERLHPDRNETEQSAVTWRVS